MEDFNIFFTPEEQGRYVISGRVVYNKKLTFEKSSILNVQPSEEDLITGRSILDVFDKSTIIYVLLYMLFVFMLVALLIPRSEIIGIVLQVLAGLIFLVYQFREKILEKKLIEKLTKALNNIAFQSNLPLLVIPFIVPLALVLYFRFSSTDIPWVQALISITVATSFSCFFYLFVVVNTQRWVQRLVHWIRQKLGKAEQQLAIDLISNIICDYYLSQKKGESDHESNRGKPD